MSRVVVIGNATVDVIQRVAHFPLPGETLLAAETLVCAGGKGLNQAVAAARAGVPVALLAARGEDAHGRLLAEALAGESALSVDWRIVGAESDVSSIWIDGAGENVIVSSSAAAAALTPADAENACRTLTSSDILLVQGNLAADTTVAALKAARAKRAGTILNTAPMRDWMAQCLLLADIVIANEVEAAALSDRAADPEAALTARGVAMLVVSRGRRGATFSTAKERGHVSAPDVAPVDTAGAGDVLVGTLAGLLVSTRRDATAVIESLRIAVAAASLSVTRRGTTPSFPTGAEIANLRESRPADFGSERHA